MEEKTYTISENQLNLLIEKIKCKIKEPLRKEGKSSKGADIAHSVESTIKNHINYFKSE